MTSIRSQSASAVSADHASLFIISGYADFVDDDQVYQDALRSMEKVGGKRRMKEQKLPFNYTSRLAAAITLHSGQILVTGGKNREKQVFLVDVSSKNYIWTPREDMLYPRIGHAIARVNIGPEECVFVAGGYDQNLKFHKSVEFFKVCEDKWRHSPYDLPNPRAFFLLQVITLNHNIIKLSGN